MRLVFLRNSETLESLITKFQLFFTNINNNFFRGILAFMQNRETLESLISKFQLFFTSINKKILWEIDWALTCNS